VTPRDWWLAGLLVTAMLAAHGGALGGSFHYDDLFAIVNNPAVRVWEPWRAFVQVDAVNIERGAVGYRPLTVVSFALNHRISGLDPFPYLATNLVLHALAAFFVFLVGRELLGDRRWAALAGALFALHPVNAEAVNYVVARSSVQSTLLALAATWLLFRGMSGAGSRVALSASLVAFVGAMLTKESAVVLVIPVLAFISLRPGDRTNREPLTGAARWVVAAYVVVGALFVAFWLWITTGGVSAPDPTNRPVWTYVELVGRSLALWFWPSPLGLDHPLTFLTRFDGGLAALLALAAVGILLTFVVLVRRVPVAAWGLLWALAGLAPLAPLPWLTTLGLFQEHRLSFSAAGLSWLTAAVVREGWRATAWCRAERAIRSIVTGAGVVLAVWAVSTDRARSAVWHDDRRLWSEVVERSPDNLVARINLGAAYMENAQYDRAEAEYRAIIALVPAYPRAYYNLGLLALRRGRTDEAVAAFRHTVALAPRNAPAYAHLGLLALRAGDVSGAEAEYRSALRIDPAQRDALNNLAAMYLQRRDWSKALSLVDDALQREPGFLEASYNRGVALAGLGRRTEAETVLRDVRRRLPGEPAFDKYRSGIDHLLAGGAP
jgi:tetratricopeptide (TPR) repeat protein